MLKKRRFFLVPLLLFSLMLNTILLTRPIQADTESYHIYQQILQNVFYYIQTMFVEEVDEKTLLIGAIRGMLSATEDPYTRFLDKEEHEEFNRAEGGQKIGIGVEVSLKGGVPIVIAPIEGSPAHKAGVRPGDKILSIDGVETHQKDFGKILKMISGDIGTTVELKLQRSGVPEPLTIQIKRGLFNLEYIKYSYLNDGDVGYIRLTQFFGEESGVVEKFRGYLHEFKNKNVKGIIVDLRDNTGGHLEMAATLSGYFLTSGKVITIVRSRGEKVVREIRSQSITNIIPENIPVVILINGGSASASEIMAGALQDYGRAKLIGTRSFGKASVQQIVRPLYDDTAALITIQKYYTPKNRMLHGKGLEPDIEVKGVEPSIDEKYYLYKMQKNGFINEFKKNHPVYKNTLPEIFVNEMQKKGWEFSKPIATLFLKREYGSTSNSTPDIEIDAALDRAVKELIK